MSISSINQRTEFLSQDQQQWENSAMTLATSEQPKREGQDQNSQEQRQALKEREGRKERKYPNKKGGRKERHKMEDFGKKIFRGQSELRKVHHLGLRSLWNNHFEDAKGGNNKQ
jgi:hypothetical protein